MQKLHF
jgi:hypothetical protein